MPAAVGPVTDINPAPNAVLENSGVGTLVGITARAVDPDATNNTVTYTLTNSAGGRFVVNSTTGVVSVAAGAVLDFETANQLSIAVRATSSDGSFSTQTFALDVTNVDEGARVTLSNVEVEENQPAGTSVGTLGVADSNAISPLFSLVRGAGSADNFRFAIDGNELVTKSSFNFESKSTYSIRVQAFGINRTIVTRVFTIEVTDANEGPTRLTLSPATIPENNAIGATVGTLAAVDPDVGDVLNFTLVTGKGSKDNARFTISGNQLQAAEVFDYERRRSFSIRVRVTDADGLTYEKILKVRVSNGPG